MGKQMVVCHVDKGKNSTPTGGLSAHVNREQKEAQKNIDENRSHLNLHLVGEEKTIDQAVNERLEQVKPKLKRAIRKDAVTHSRIIMSGSTERMNSMSEEELMNWSADSIQFLADRYGHENVVKAVLHRDEKTPHMHVYLTPVSTQIDAKGNEYLSLSHNKIFNRTELRELQTDYAKEVGELYGLERGVNGSPRKHVTTREFYKYLESIDREVEEVVNELSRDELMKLVVANHREKQPKKEKEKHINKNLHHGRKKQTKEPRRQAKPSKERSEEIEERKRKRDNGISF